VTAFSQFEESENAAHLSIFSFLSGRGDETMLNITYRLNDILSDWPSRTFYGNALSPSVEAAGRRLQLSSNSSRLDFILDPASPAVFLDLCHRNTTVRSRKEAEMAVELILALLEHGISPEEIGVVVPYRAQSRLIRSLLRRQILDETTLGRLVIDTVERMQGQEREVVLVSFATASPAFALQMADFLFQPQRLNVAVTRPRSKLILIGSRHMLDGASWSFDDTQSVYEKPFALLTDLLESCTTITLPEGRLL
jgi:DNA replication ATP-dependent helicase Dna2